jgi:Ca-activated chloride channel family protein
VVQTGPAAVAAAQDPTAVFRSQVEVVLLNVTVTDPKGRLVPGLQQEDFTVFEDGAPQRVTFFASGDVPLDLELLIDTSSSMRPRLPVTRIVAGNFLSRLRSIDLGSVVAFSDYLEVLQPPTNDLGRLRASLQLLEARGGTSLYTSLYVMVRELSRRAGQRTDKRRSAVVVLTDGADTTSLTSYGDLLDEVRRSNVAIYPISFNASPAAQAGAEDGQRRFLGPSDYGLNKIASETGGRAFFPRQLTDLAGIYGEIAHELATQYALAYARSSQSADSTFHRLSVQVSGRTDATLRTRLGFYAGRFGQVLMASADR